MKCTMEAAKTRYKQETRKLLVKRFCDQCDSALWGEIDGYPTLLDAGNRPLLHFRKDERGVFAIIGHPDGYKGSASRAFGKGDR